MGDPGDLGRILNEELTPAEPNPKQVRLSRKSSRGTVEMAPTFTPLPILFVVGWW